jgi:hypothetical protein
MDAVRVFNYNNQTFFHLEDIKKAKLNADFFVNCKTIRRCIQKHNIPDDCCLYVKKDKVFDRTYLKADLYLLDEYVNNNILNADYQQKKNQQATLKKEQQQKDRAELMKQRKRYDPSALQDLPDLIELEDHEKFKGENDEPLEIEVRGEKTLEGAFFKASDIGSAFQYDRIEHTVTDNRGDYQYNEHYIIFNPKEKLIGRGNSSSRELYLTYLGVLKFLFCSRGNKAGRFQKWASHILFAVQMGTQNDREVVAAEALSLSHKQLQDFLNMSAGAISCVYLVRVGTVGNMKEHFDLQGFDNDEHTVYKFGKSKDLGRRLPEHFNIYGKKINNDEINLVCYSYIDDDLMTNAENRLKEYFHNFGMHVKDKKHTELIVMDEKCLKSVTKIYDDLFYSFSGKNKQIINQLTSLKQQYNILEEQYKAELRVKDSQMETKDANIREHEAVIREKEWELKYLRKMEELRNKGIEC